MTTHNITLDLDKTLRTPPPLVTARQGDTQCGIAASVTDHGAPASLAGYTARFQAAKPDGTYADQTADIDGSTVSVTLAPEFLSAEGLIKTAYFRFFEGADEKESTQNLTIRVLHDAEGESPDPTGDYVSAVDDLIAEVQGALDDVNGAVEDASEATAAANAAASSANAAASNADAAALEADAAADAAQSALGAMTGNVLKGETEAGVVASAGDAYAQTPLGVKVYGETRQNLWMNPSGTMYGVTSTANNDGSFSVSGTSSADVSNRLKSGALYTLKPNTNYILSIGAESETIRFFGLTAYKKDGTNIDFIFGGAQYGGLTKTFTTPSDLTHCECCFGIPTAGTTTSGTYRVMLNEGSEAQPWCPPGLNSVGQLRDDEKNLWVNPSTQTVSGVAITNNPDGTFSLSGTAASSITIECGSVDITAGKTYSIDMEPPNDDGSVRGTVMTAESDTAFIRTNAPKTAVAPSSDGGYKASLVVIAGTTVSGTYRVMLNEGSTPAPWVPPGCETAVQVATKGKNLLPCLVERTYTPVKGVTAKVIADGSVYISGTLEGNQAVSVLPNKALGIDLPPGSYVVSDGCDNDLVYMQVNANGTIFAGSNDVSTTTTTTTTTTTGAYFFVGVKPGFSGSATIYPQLELGSTATDYEPPQPIDLTPIDLDGHVLASLPDGTRDELVIGQDGTATVESACGYVGSYTDENVGEDYVASALDADGGIAQGAQVVYKLDAVQSYAVPSVALPALPAPSFNAWVQPGECEVAGDTSVEYAKDVNMVVGSLEERVSALEQLHAGGGQ